MNNGSRTPRPVLRAFARAGLAALADHVKLLWAEVSGHSQEFPACTLWSRDANSPVSTFMFVSSKSFVSHDDWYFKTCSSNRASTGSVSSISCTLLAFSSDSGRITTADVQGCLLSGPHYGAIGYN